MYKAQTRKLESSIDGLGYLDTERDPAKSTGERGTLHTDVHDEITKNTLAALINDADVSPWSPPSSRLKQSIITLGGQIWPQARRQPRNRS